MEKNTKIIIGVIGTLAVGGVAFWLIRKNKKKKEQEALGGDEETTVIEETTQEPTKTSTSTSSSSSSSSKPENVLEFQKYANQKGHQPKLVEDGIWGSKSSGAWKLWGTDYQKDKMAGKINVSSGTTGGVAGGVGAVTKAIFGVAKPPEQSTYNVENRAKRLYYSMKGLGTDEDAFFNVWKDLNNTEKKEVRNYFYKNLGGGHSLKYWITGDFDGIDEYYALKSAGYYVGNNSYDNPFTRAKNLTGAWWEQNARLYR